MKPADSLLLNRHEASQLVDRYVTGLKETVDEVGAAWRSLAI